MDVSLSSVVEEQLRRLCLKDFPCGRGSWSKSTGNEYQEQNWGYMEQDEQREGSDKEEQETLIELLTSPVSPWQQEVSWSPQALVLRELSVQTPECLHGNSIYNHFTTLRIVDKGVSIIDDGLLRFSSLKELVLSANKISDVHASHLPCTLRVLELYANQVSSLKDISCPRLHCLQHLGLGSNRLGSPTNIQHLTGGLWPQLVSLDLSWSEFQGQQALVEALATMPCLRTLVLEGNPLTLTPSYPGFTLDSLPRILYLDASRVTPDDRHQFRGLANMRDLIVDQAVAMVTVGKIMGVPDPLVTLDDNAPEFPVVSYNYFVTYEFLSQPPTGNNVQDISKDTVSTSDTPAAIAEKKEGGVSVFRQKTDTSCEEELSKTNSLKIDNTAMTTEIVGNTPSVAKHSTAKLVWAESMDLDHTNIHSVDDLGLLKSFLLRGMWLFVEEEKVLSWPAPTGEPPGPKPSTEKKGGKDCARPPSNTCSNQKSKDKKKKKDSILDLVQDTPIRRTLGSVHVPLQDLMMGGQRVSVLCDLGVLYTEQSTRATASRDKDPNKKNKDDKKDEKKGKSGSDSAGGQKNAVAAKGNGKGRKESEPDVRTDDTYSNQLKPMSVELSVHLQKWHSASEAHSPHRPQ